MNQVDCPLISVIIPSYNYGRFIRQCIDNCLAQNVTKEIIVIDGGSTDGTVDFLRAYGNQIQWVSERDRGQSDAINKGVRLACGEVIAWLNADDFYPHSESLKIVADNFSGDPEVDIVFGDGKCVDVNGGTFRQVSAPQTLTWKDLLLGPGCCVFQPSLFFRRSLFSDAGGVDVNLYYAMDLDLWLRMLPLARKVVRVPQVLSCLRVHHDAKTFSGLRRSFDEAYVVKRKYRSRVKLTLHEHFRFMYGWMRINAYWLAVLLHLKKATPT